MQHWLAVYCEFSARVCGLTKAGANFAGVVMDSALRYKIGGDAVLVLFISEVSGMVAAAVPEPEKRIPARG
jgi:hypothetical protein